MVTGINGFGMPPMNMPAPTWDFSGSMNNSIWSMPPAPTVSTPAPAPQPTAEELAEMQRQQQLVAEMNASGLGLTNEEMEVFKGIMAKRSDAARNKGIGEYAMTDGISMAMTGMMMPMVAGAGTMFGLNHIAEAEFVQNSGAFVKKYSGYEWASNTKFGQATGKFMNKGLNKSEAAARLANRKWGAEGTKWTGKVAKGFTNGCNSLTKGIVKYGGWTAAATTVIDDWGKLKTAYGKDTTTGLKQTGQTAVKAAGAGVGAWAGAKAGASLGATIGAFAGPVGAAIGGAIGAIGGALFGSWGGKKVAQAVVGKDVADKVQEENVTKAGEVATDENGVQYNQASEEQMAAVQDTLMWAQTQSEDAFTPEELAVIQKLMGA